MAYNTHRTPGPDDSFGKQLASSKRPELSNEPREEHRRHHSPLVTQKKRTVKACQASHDHHYSHVRHQQQLRQKNTLRLSKNLNQQAAAAKSTQQFLKQALQNQKLQRRLKDESYAYFSQ